MLLGLFLGVWLLGFAGAAEGQAPPPLRITFLDVGQGDAVLIRAPDGQVALVDAGPGVDIVPRLRQLGVEKVDLLVASHAHADHIGGMTRVIAGIPVRKFMDNGLPYTTSGYRALMRTLARRTEIEYLEAVPRTISLGTASIEVLPLPPDRDDQNNRSVTLLVHYGAFVAFLSGDSERRELSWLVARGAVPDVTLLKAAHHGSSDGFTPGFLRASRPEVVVISLGANEYGHPHVEALAAYGSIRARVLRTDLRGEVTISGYLDGHFDVSEPLAPHTGDRR